MRMPKRLQFAFARRPLKRWQRIGHWIVLVWMATGITYRILWGGNILVPVVILVFAIVGLLEDRKARRAAMP